MRLGRFQTPDGRVLYGRLVDERSAQPLADGLFGDRAASAAAVPIARLLAPIEPPNIFAIGRNYRAHAEETGSAVPEKPLVFQKATTSVNDPGGAIVLPAAAPDEVDYEGELAIVIGRRCRRVAVGAALEFVLGYTCAIDVSARDCQRNDKQWARAKGFDTFCPLGPWIVTADALEGDACELRTRVNGELRQCANTRQMMHGVRQIVAYLSEAFTLLPGTVILTGTPEGVGMARKPPVFLKPGDRIEVEIEGLGTLVSSVAAE